MLFVKILHYILGYLRFRIYGDFPERLLNILAAKGVSVWDTVKKEDYIEASILIKDYKQIHSLKGKCRVKTRHIEPIGLFIKLKSYRARVGFATGFALFLVIIKVLSLFIWQIEIVGNNYTDGGKIKEALADEGVFIGAKVSEIDAFNLAEKLILHLPEVAWMAVNIEGSLATVDISEVNIVPDRSKTEPCNLKARLDGRITGHRVTDGRLEFKIGDVVVAGDLLVSGAIEHANGYTSLKHAAGEVFAETKHEISHTSKFNQTHTVRTGRAVTKSVVGFFGKSLPLYLGSEQYPFECEGNEQPLTLLGKELPISLTKAVFYETKDVEVTLSREEAVLQARNLAEAKAAYELGNAGILSKNEEIVEENDGITVRNLYICNENIALEEILSITTINN